MPQFVVPTLAGIQCLGLGRIPIFAGMTDQGMLDLSA